MRAEIACVRCPSGTALPNPRILRAGIVRRFRRMCPRQSRPCKHVLSLCSHGRNGKFPTRKDAELVEAAPFTRATLRGKT